MEASVGSLVGSPLRKRSGKIWYHTDSFGPLGYVRGRRDGRGRRRTLGLGGERDEREGEQNSEAAHGRGGVLTPKIGTAARNRSPPQGPATL